MRRYYYRMFDMWLSCFAKSKKQVVEMLQIAAPDIVFTEKEALKLAERDPELAKYIENSHLCDLMCG